MRKVLMLLLLLGHLSSAGQGYMQSALSVVKVQCEFVGPSTRSVVIGTGWCFGEPNIIVTALHVVAGANKITVIHEPTNKTCAATVEKALREGDLALLRLKDCSLNIAPLSLEAVDPNSEDVFHIWGYPASISRIKGDELKFSLSLKGSPPPTLMDILGDSKYAKLRSELRDQGFPSVSSRIIRVSSTFISGHSGAPIFNNSGKVVGVADGGLREGVAGLNWAIPAQEYVGRLTKSSDALPNKMSVQSDLYGDKTELPLDLPTDKASVDKAIMTALKENVVANGSILRTWASADFSLVYKTLRPVPKKNVDEIISKYGLDMSDTRFDVYEDTATGAAFAVPAREKVTVKNSWYYANTEDNSIQYCILSWDSKVRSYSYSQAAETISGYFSAKYQWQEDSSRFRKWILGDSSHFAYLRNFTDTLKNRQGQAKVEFTGNRHVISMLFWNEGRKNDPAYLKRWAAYKIATYLNTFPEK